MTKYEIKKALRIKKSCLAGIEKHITEREEPNEWSLDLYDRIAGEIVKLEDELKKYEEENIKPYGGKA